MNPSAAGNWLPFAAFNLRCNPFGEKTREDRAFLAVVDRQRWLQLATIDLHALQFIGDCGRGKTTHLLSLWQSLPQSAYVYLPEDGPLPKIPSGSPLLIDEAQRLPCRIRRQVFRQRVPLILGTHVDLTRVLRRHGYTVHTVHVEQLVDAKHLANLLNRRLIAARIDEQKPIPLLSLRDAKQLLDQFGTDIRAVESHLYERIQQYAGGPCVEVQFVD